MRDAAIEAADRLEAGAASDRGAAGAACRAADLGRPRRRRAPSSGSPSSSAAIAAASDEAARLSDETGPALVAALVQVREAAAHAAERAREAIADGHSRKRRRSLARRPATRSRRRSARRRGAARRSRPGRGPRGRDRARGVRPADPADAVDRPERGGARSAYRAEPRGAAQGRRRGLRPPRLAADGFDALGRDRRAARSCPTRSTTRPGAPTSRAIAASSPAARCGCSAAPRRRAHRRPLRERPRVPASVNRYVHDFEAMLRRVLAERDGGMIAVTLMSSRHGQALRRAGPGDRAAPLTPRRSVVEVEVVDRDPAEVPIGVIEREQHRGEDRRAQQVALAGRSGAARCRPGPGPSARRPPRRSAPRTAA